MMYIFARPTLPPPLPATNEEKENHNHSMIMQFKEGFVHFKNEVILQHRDYFRDLANAQHPTVRLEHPA